MDAENTVTILGATVSRKIVPWSIGFVVLISVISYLFFGGSDYDYKAEAKKKKETSISEAEKRLQPGTEEEGREFINKAKIEAEEKARKGKLPEPTTDDLPVMPLPKKIDTVEYEQLKQTRNSILGREGDIEAPGKENINPKGFVPGAGLRGEESGFGNSNSSGDSGTGGFFEDYKKGGESKLKQEMESGKEDVAAKRSQKNRTEIEARRASTEAAAIAAASQGGNRKPSKSSDQVTDAEWRQEKSKSLALETTQPIFPTRVSIRHVLLEGSIIPISLEGEVDTELPGRISGRVVSDIYDGIYGTSLLIPRGSKVMGEYNSSVKDGQSRMMLAFSRIILSDGRSIRLPAMDGSDEMGRAGVEADVDNRWFLRFGPAFMVGMAQIFNPGVSITVNHPNGSSVNYQDAATEKTWEMINKVSEKLLTRYEGLKPILRLDKGTRMNIVVTKDIAIPPDGNFAWDASGLIKDMGKQ